MEKPAFDPKAFVREMLEDDHAMAFFSKFDAKQDRIEEFLTAYGKHKANVLENGDSFTRHIHNMEEVHKEMAWKAYGAILSRKLFILQCRWRAEQVILKDIDISYEFWQWGEDQYRCPFIGEVTAQELELMKGFLLRREFRKWDLEMYENWQNYDEYVAPPEEKINSWNEYPRWFAYCDEHGYDPDWRALPNIRGQKEQAYMDAVRGGPKETYKTDHTPVKETKKSILYDDRELMAAELADVLGDTTTAQYIRDRYDARKGQLFPDVDTTLMYFRAFHTEEIPVCANENWGEGLNMAADQFFARRAAAVLEETHEEYLYRKANDLLENDKENIYGFTIDRFREVILKGRTIKGEPRDFNF